jgi:tetratricopeptide (TPR) repeat protein
MRTIFIAWIIVSAAATAHADERAVAREHYVKGTKSFDLGLYEDAIVELMAAYKAKDDPAFLYNIAQAHRLAGHTGEALRFYRVYLIKLPHAPNRDDVEVKIAELQKAIEQQKKTQTSLPPDQVIRPTPLPDQPPRVEPAEDASADGARLPKVTAPPAPATPPSAAVIAPPPPRDHRADRRLKIAGVATAGVGVAVLIAGVASAVLASQTADQISRSPTFDPKQLDTYHTYQALEGALLGVGAAAVVSGAIVYAVGWRRSRSPRFTVAPAATRGGAVVSVFATW